MTSVISAEATPGVTTAVAICNIWFVVWAIRRQGELDYDLDRTAGLIRWILVAALLGPPLFLPQVFGVRGTLRVSVAFAGLFFLVWPNSAYHLTKLLRSLRLIPKLEGEAANRQR